MRHLVTISCFRTYLVIIKHYHLRMVFLLLQRHALQWRRVLKQMCQRLVYVKSMTHPCFDTFELDCESFECLFFSLRQQNGNVTCVDR